MAKFRALLHDLNALKSLLKQAFFKNALLFAFCENRTNLPLRALQAWQATKKQIVATTASQFVIISEPQVKPLQHQGAYLNSKPLNPATHHKKHSKANKLYLFTFLPPCFLPCFAPALTVSMRVMKSLLNSRTPILSLAALSSAHFSISVWLMLWASIFPLLYS